MSRPRHRPPPEAVVQVLILLIVAGMAGAASFTHVHDWTMRNVPAGTGSWFGWANAIITELVPLACGLEVRRRKRRHRSVTYPMAILITDAAVSLAAQLSDAIHTLAGSLAVALPALAFLALTKLILARTRADENSQGETQCAKTAPSTGASGQLSPPGQATTASVPATTGPTSLAPGPPTPTLPTTSLPVSKAMTPVVPPVRDPFRDLKPVPPGHLVMSARMTAFDHQNSTGHPITTGELAERLAVPPALA
jgi:hypothetical protein